MSDAKSFAVTVVDTGPDFQLQLSPPAQILPPGGSTSFLVLVDSFDGFQSPVSLTVPSLPAGVTASFSSNPVTPPGSATLTLSAAGGATGDFTLEVAGTSGDVTHTTSGDVGLNFGLVPVCYGAFAGMVSDRETGTPLPGVSISVGASRWATTDGHGHYAVTDLALGYNNAAASYLVRTSSVPGYWDASVSAIAKCDQITVVDLRLVARQHGSVGGVVYEGIADPNSPTVVTPTVPLSNAVVSALDSDVGSVASGANGLFQLPPLELSPNNEPREYRISASKAGFWSASEDVTVQAGEHVSVTLALVPVCTASITGTVYYAPEGQALQPAGNVGVDLRPSGGGSSNFGATTDAEGHFWLSDVPVAHNNAPAAYSVHSEISAGGIQYANTITAVYRCGANATTLILYPPPQRTVNYGTLAGHVYDEETGEPLAGAYVYGTYTDGAGAYSAQVLVGYDNDTSSIVTVYASLDGYWSKSAGDVLVRANQTTPLDFRLLKKRYGWVAGTVRDTATQQPITNATSSSLPTTQPTGADGAYQSPALELAAGNQPRSVTFSMEAPGYWPKQASATITANQTTTVDVDLTKICQGASIGGRVLNAWTQQPIEGATVSASGQYTTTDSAGRFRLADLAAGPNNAPRQVTVSASASGFYPQSKTVTIFCGAAITVDFGRSEQAFGTIEGTITNLATGQPMADVFVGSEFGGSATTDASGYYLLTDVPLGDNGADRTWSVTAMPGDFEAQTRSVTATANATVRLDFAFGTPPPNSPPSITPPEPQVADAGVAKAFDLGSFDDPGALDSPWSAAVDWGDATPQVTFTVYLTGSLGTRWHTYAAAGSHDVTVTITDSGTPRLSDSQSFRVTVSSVNRPPVLDPIGDKTITQTVPLVFTATASDPDGGTLTFSLDPEAPGGASIDPATGEFRWTPTAEQGPGTYQVTIRVTDEGMPPLSAAETISITVVEAAVGLPPVAAFVASPISGTRPLEVQFTDLSSGTITSCLWRFGDGATSEEEDPVHTYATAGVYTATLTVTGPGGSDTLTRTNYITVYEPVTAAFTAGPISGTYPLVVDFTNRSTGDYTSLLWEFGDGGISTEQNPTHTYVTAGAYTVTLTATGPGGSDTVSRESYITTASSRRPLFLAPIGSKAVAWGNTLAFTATATGSDVVNFSLTGAPAGASIDPSSGQFNWLPAADQVGIHSFTVAVADNGTPPLAASETITVTVEKRGTRIVYEGSGSGEYSDPVSVTARLLDDGGGVLQGSAVAGKTISFTIGSQVATAATDTAGRATATIKLAQPAGSPGAGATFLEDSRYRGSSSTATFVIEPEQATLEYTGDSLVATSSTKANSTATLSLAAAIKEAADNSLGDKLGSTEVRFSLFKFSDVAMASAVATCTATARGSGSGTATAGCSLALGPDNYVVEIELLGKGYYQASVELQALTIVQGGEGATTGGGWVVEPSLGARSNFGFTVKSLKNGVVQGKSLYIYRLRTNLGYGLRDYNLIIKSNAMKALQQQCTRTKPTVCTATFTGSNTISAVDRETGRAFDLGGNYQFQVDVTDNGEPLSSGGSRPDSYAIRVWNSAGTYYTLGAYAGATNSQQLSISGGNIQVRPK